MEVKKKYLYLIRSIYLCMLTAYTILREVIPLQSFEGGIKIVLEMVAYLFFGGGVLLVVASFWLDRDHATKVNVGLFIAFTAVCIISTLINFKYDFLSNVKAIGWMCLYFFLLYPFGFYSKENKRQTISSIFGTAFIILTLLVLISLPMYFFNIEYSYTGLGLTGEYYTKGFHQTYMRLWGVFNDANSAAAYAIIAILMSCYLFLKNKNLVVRILMSVADVFLVIFIVLTGSRMGILVSVLVCAYFAFYLAYKLVKIDKIKKIGISILSCVLAGLIGYGVLTGVTYAMPYVKSGVNSICGTSFSRSVHIAYDNAYKALGVNIVSGYYQENESDSNLGNTENSGSGNNNVVRPDMENKDDISNGRFAKWVDALEIFLLAPIFGTSPRGASSFGKIYCPENEISIYDAAVHNSLLEVLMRTGIIGFLIITVVLVSAGGIIIKNIFKKKFDVNFLLFSGIILALFAYSIFVSDLFFIISFGGIAFWLTLGLLDGEDKYVLTEEIIVENADGKKRILVYGPKDPIGGVEKIVLEYVKNIIATHKDVSFDFLMYGKNFSLEKELTNLGCRVIYLPSRFRHYFKYKKAIEEVFANNRYIAVWGNYSGLTNIDLLVLAKKYYVPVRIAHSHNSRLTWKNSLTKYIVIFMHYYNKFFVKDFTTDFWACSNLAGEFMFPKSVYKDIRMVVNAVDVSKFYPNKELGDKIRKELNIEKNDLVIGHVARMCYQKNQLVLLGVMAEIVKKVPNAKLLMIGDGELRNQLELEVKRLNIENSVLFLGQRADIPDLLRAMDVFVLTSRFEGLAVSAVEAQACGVPCVLPTSVSKETDITGFVEFVSLDDNYDAWSEKILKISKIDFSNATEKIINSGYEIRSASENLWLAFQGLKN